MAEEINYDQILLDNGFLFHEFCSCNGTPQAKYRKGAWELKVYYRKSPKRFSARLSNRSMKVANITELQSYLISIS